MNTTHFQAINFTLKTSIVCFVLFLVSASSFAQIAPVTEQDSIKTGHSLGRINMGNPASIVSRYTYDAFTDRYIYTESVGEFNINYPIILTPREFEELVQAENLKTYYKQKIDAFDGKKLGTEDGKKNLLPEFYVNSSFFESIFGGGTVEVIPQGSVEMDLGVLFSKQDNPAFSPRNRSNFSFDFDQRISLSLLGKVGTRLQVTANYDTQSTFDFQNLVKLEYTPTEDDIIQKIEVGNVSMPLNSSLITGAQSLFGVKTQLQFGKTTITGIFSEQQSETNTVISQGGGTLEEFELFARDYDENRHFFLAQYFREKYDTALSNYPYINTNVQITRIEAWITNRNNTTDNVRNIVAFQDLGESNPELIGSAVNVFASPAAYPDNGNNGYDPTSIGQGNSQLTSAIRDVATVQSGILVGGTSEGNDYAKLENARKLTQGSEYTLNTQLGYISLNSRLSSDEVLAVAFQFTVGGKVYQVGEFANDGVDATGIDNSNSDQTVVTNNNLVLKLLKSPITSVNQPVWKLMMKNIYSTGAYQLSQEDFKLNIFYTEASPLNYITPVGGDFGTDFNGEPIQEVPLLRLFNFDKLNYNGDPQAGGDGFFDYEENITVISSNGQIVFTKVEPFGEYLFDILDIPTDAENYEDPNTYNANQKKYVFNELYEVTKTKALDYAEKNKFQLIGRYSSSGGDGISIGAFNVPRGSVTVTAGGRVLVEGIDYTVNYQLGQVQILDEALKASDTPIQVSTENNSVFGQQTKRFMGFNVDHQFSDNFVLGATLLNLSERPITQKANYSNEPINNTIFGFNGNYSTEVPFLTRLVNKLPNIDTDVPSNVSVRGEFAYLKPGSPKGTDFDGEATAYVDDFEVSQTAISLLSQQSWFLSSRPLDLNVAGNPNEDENGIQNGYQRAMLNWYTIDPIFYTSQRPSDMSDNDMSGLYTSRVFIQELFPQQGIAQGQSTVINTLDLAYYPDERGPYNFEPNSSNGTIPNPDDSWAGITRSLTTTDFEQSNVEYIEFWLQDPFQENESNPGGKLVFNLGNISEDVLKDGRKQYENGLPKDGATELLTTTAWGTVVPQNQALVYAFDSQGDERTNQDVGYDGYNDAQEAAIFGSEFGPDPANDNYTYFLNTNGDIFQRYKQYNGVEGNSPETFTDTNRGSTTLPDVEDINRDNTMNTIDSYYEYELDLTPQNLPDNPADIGNIPESNPLSEYIKDIKVEPRALPNGQSTNVRWYQFRIPVESDNAKAVGGISDLRSVRFARMYLKEFEEATVFRFGTLDLVRSDWRRYTLALDKDDVTPDDPETDFSVGVISTLENDGIYQSPPDVEPEELYNNNTVIEQDEQSLVVEICNLEEEDSRAVYKNIDIDMRQYKRIRMFVHAEDDGATGLTDYPVAFIRMGNDVTQNYYQIEIPLKTSEGSSREALWPEENEINLAIELLQEIKSIGLADGSLSNEDPTFYDVIGDELSLVTDQYSGYVLGQHRIGIKGNPNFGDIRTLMLGVKNGSRSKQCGVFWFNELRLSDMDNEGGWAAVLSVDSNIADFANVSAAGRQSTAGFGTIEQGPSERSLEDVVQYDLVTNVNLGQLLPKKWGVQLPFNYGISEEKITPKYDEYYQDLELDAILNNTNNKDSVLNVNENYTKRKSINFIGVRKIRTGEAKPHFYDVENFTFNYSFNKVEHRDFEIENSVDKTVRLGANYAYNFTPKTIEPFKKNDSLFTGKYWKILKDFNFNYLPTTFTVSSNFLRSYNKQRYREVELSQGNIGLEDLYRRNYTFDFQYTFSYNLTRALQINFTTSKNNIVRNYFKDNIINGEQDSSLDVFDGFLDIGDPNRQYQQLGINYELPLYKIPFLSFLQATYGYTGDFQWQKGSDLYGDLSIDGQTYDLGNSIQNANTHNLNASMDMNTFYKYIGLVKKPAVRSAPSRNPQAAGGPRNEVQTSSKSNAWVNAGIDLVTMVKRIQLNYQENNGTYLPGYLETPGFLGTIQPTFGYTIGSQSDIRQLAARKGWLTVYDNFNEQYTEIHNKQLDISANLEPTKDLKIDLIFNRLYSETLTENFVVNQINNNYEYQALTPSTYGNFNISTLMIKTAFGKSDETTSQAFDDFRANRLKISRRLAQRAGVDMSNPDNFEGGDVNGYVLGFGKTSQAVLLPAFLSAYQGVDANDVSLGAFRNVPLPNWDLKYTGFMRMAWFKKNFKRFSVGHGYRSSYTINQFATNLDYNGIDYSDDYLDQPDDVLNQSGDYKSENLYSNINLTEMFSPLIRLDFEMNNSVKILAEIQKDRLLSLSFDNNLMTEIIGNEYILGLGYRIKDVRMKSKLAGPNKTIVSDINMKADVSLRENKTIIRYLDLENNQITSGQTIWGLKYTADYAFSKNLSAIFYFDYSFSEYAISTAFPQTTLRSGLTLRYNFGN
ncbi:gliding motility-related SprA protein [Formosa agariphila KMM 3901]|uniref:Gliding motility-related SprA protein n=1 Tax=Formosa agariphila (strain DSM 15362 / KCTC 12365 / LMG 23005 / KMM 3901 / M-2Alg 35-1) TaxID=1347342 RepID=T2KHR1_FORAG|nr:cell surface protein SprA [Formosa agariphila]CDF77948.1 gliding motility-related SprA protein [Formosa agariphila KMM 3901]